MIGSEVEELDHNGSEEPEKLNLNQLKKAFGLKKLKLWYNEIETIENIGHLKKLERLSLSNNRIKQISPGCFNGLILKYLRLRDN